jgi:hypothetical protein
MANQSEYRLYKLDHQGDIITQQTFVSPCDGKAVDVAIYLSSRYAHEVWLGSKLLAHIEPH